MSSVRKKKSEGKRWWTKIFRLNVFPGEYGCDVDSLVFDVDEDEKERTWKNTIASVEWQLQVARQQASANDEIIAQQNVEKAELTLRADRAEEEVAEKQHHLETLENENNSLRHSVTSLRAEKRKAEEEENQVLGRKRLCELGPDSINHTKTAYKKKFAERINHFGTNRGLKFQQLVLSVSISHDDKQRM